VDNFVDILPGCAARPHEYWLATDCPEKWHLQKILMNQSSEEIFAKFLW
jgi:hypothetical protein